MFQKNDHAVSPPHYCRTNATRRAAAASRPMDNHRHAGIGTATIPISHPIAAEARPPSGFSLLEPVADRTRMAHAGQGPHGGSNTVRHPGFPQRWKFHRNRRPSGCAHFSPPARDAGDPHRKQALASFNTRTDGRTGGAIGKTNHHPADRAAAVADAAEAAALLSRTPLPFPDDPR